MTVYVMFFFDQTALSLHTDAIFKLALILKACCAAGSSLLLPACILILRACVKNLSVTVLKLVGEVHKMH